MPLQQSLDAGQQIVPHDTIYACLSYINCYNEIKLEIVAGGDGGLLHLRCPSCRREVSGIVDLLPVGGVDPRLGFPFSRFCIPDLVSEAAASARLQNKSSLVRPRTVGVPL